MIYGKVRKWQEDQSYDDTGHSPKEPKSKMEMLATETKNKLKVDELQNGRAGLLTFFHSNRKFHL